jgi:hypothetical protein
MAWKSGFPLSAWVGLQLIQVPLSTLESAASSGVRGDTYPYLIAIQFYDTSHLQLLLGYTQPSPPTEGILLNYPLPPTINHRSLLVRQRRAHRIWHHPNHRIDRLWHSSVHHVL